jgi:hypothetical protein
METRPAGWKKITAVEEKELFFSDFEYTCPVCLFTIFYAQAKVHGPVLIGLDAPAFLEREQSKSVAGRC